MTLQEIIKKIIDAAASGEEFDGESAINAFLAEKMEGVNNKNTELLGKLKKAREVSDGLPEDFSVERWNQMVKDLEGVDLSKMSTPEQVEAVKASMAQAHEEGIKSLKTREAALLDALQKTLVDGVVGQAINEAHGNSTLLTPHITQRVKMVEEDGNFRAIVVDNNGLERYSLAKAGEKMSISELIGEFKTNPVYASAFNAGNGGGGANNSGGGGDVKNPFLKGTPHYSLTEQSKLMNSDPAEAKRLQAAASEANAA